MSPKASIGFSRKRAARIGWRPCMKTIDLKGKWRLRNRGGKFDVAAQVPGDTHSALLAAKKIADPYWGKNELALLPLAREEWDLRARVYCVPANWLAEESVFIELEGLDTVAEIFVNGKLLAKTEECFCASSLSRQKELLRAGKNLLRIEIASAEKAAEAEAKRLPYPIPYNDWPVQSPHRNLIRKVQCHSGWDWGPCLMVAGIEKARISATSLGRIESLQVVQKHVRPGKPGPVTLTVTCEVILAQGRRDRILRGDRWREEDFQGHAETGHEHTDAADCRGEAAALVAERSRQAAALSADCEGRR